MWSSSTNGEIGTPLGVIRKVQAESYDGMLNAQVASQASKRKTVQELLNSTPDGYTIFLAGSAQTGLPALYRELPFDVPDPRHASASPSRALASRGSATQSS